MHVITTQINYKTENIANIWNKFLKTIFFATEKCSGNPNIVLVICFVTIIFIS